MLCVLPFENEEDVIAQANDSVYGLAAGIWTADYKRAWRVARALESGTVWINTYKQLSVATPFGGFKESGLGREKGLTGMRLYQQTKSIYLGLDNAEREAQLMFPNDGSSQRLGSRHMTTHSSFKTIGFHRFGRDGQPICRNLARKSGLPCAHTTAIRRPCSGSVPRACGLWVRWPPHARQRHHPSVPAIG